MKACGPSSKSAKQTSPESKEPRGGDVRAALFFIGIALAAAGGVLAYRALFLEPSAALVISEAGAVREVPDTLRVAGGIALLVLGAGIAFFGARRRRS